MLKLSNLSQWAVLSAVALAGGAVDAVRGCDAVQVAANAVGLCYGGQVSDPDSLGCKCCDQESVMMVLGTVAMGAAVHLLSILIHIQLHLLYGEYSNRDL